MDESDHSFSMRAMRPSLALNSLCEDTLYPNSFFVFKQLTLTDLLKTIALCCPNIFQMGGQICIIHHCLQLHISDTVN